MAWRRCFTAQSSDNGEGRIVSWGPGWRDELPIYRADVLKDILAEVQAEYERAVLDMRKDKQYRHTNAP